MSLCVVPRPRGPPQRPDQWEHCVCGHTLTDKTRVVRDNGLVQCRVERQMPSFRYRSMLDIGVRARFRPEGVKGGRLQQ